MSDLPARAVDHRRVRLLCWGVYRELRKLGDSPEAARECLVPIYKWLEADAAMDPGEHHQ